MGFWRRVGYEAVPRGEAPPEVLGSEEFASLCPASAQCMKRALSGPMRKVSAQALAWRDDPSGARFWELALTRARLTCYEVPPGASFPVHAHDGEQITYVIEGELVLEGDGGTLAAQTGEAVLVPSGTRHAVAAGPAGARAVDAWSHPLATYSVTSSREEG